MAAPLEFFFDFASPYGYLASLQIDAVAARHGRTVRWRPFMLGAAFKETGQVPLPQQKLRGPYHLHDFARSARRFGAPFKMPEPFPFAALAPSRAYYWLEGQDPETARAYAAAVYHRVFAEGRAVDEVAAAAAVGAAIGIDPAALSAAVNDPAVKARLRQVTEQAIGRGVFGSPFVFVDGEAFWGHDRLPQIEEWLDRGGW
jgi:2-hydroxychromene-2-carboxylate isomerase